MSSVLTTLPLVKKPKNYQSDNEVRFDRWKTVYSLTFSKGIGQRIREGGYMHLEAKVNELTSEIFLVFQKEPNQETLEITDPTKGESTYRKLSVFSKLLIEYVTKYLKVTEEHTKLRISDNLSNIDSCLTFKLYK